MIGKQYLFVNSSTKIAMCEYSFWSKKVANDSEMGAILTVIWVEILIIIKNT
jgi:hypothetical protein